MEKIVRYVDERMKLQERVLNLKRLFAWHSLYHSIRQDVCQWTTICGHEIWNRRERHCVSDGGVSRRCQDSSAGVGHHHPWVWSEVTPVHGVRWTRVR